MHVSFTLVLSLLVFKDVTCVPTSPDPVLVEVGKENDTPIIGVVTEEISYSLENLYPGAYKSYIAASYVKFVEGSGGRAVPIWIGHPRSYYEDIMSKINGSGIHIDQKGLHWIYSVGHNFPFRCSEGMRILLPGGATYFTEKDGYAEAGAHIYSVAKEMNDEGNYFPIWGTCLGFELLTFLSAEGKEHRANCRSNSQPLHLEFKDDFKSSRMFSNADDAVISILQNEAVTSNFHQYCVTEQNLTAFNIQDEWKVLSLNHDWDGLEFISSLEHTKYPFYGIQFHPEKNVYEWIPNRNITHTHNAIVANRHFGDFFMSEARKNMQTFGTRSEEQKYLIYQYSSTYTGIKGSAFEQCYLFDEATNDQI